jgi:hypothetical protein
MGEMLAQALPLLYVNVSMPATAILIKCRLKETRMRSPSMPNSLMPEFISASSIGPSDTGGALSAEIAYVMKLHT